MTKQFLLNKIDESLFKAAEENKESEVLELLKQGANVNAKDIYGFTPLYVAGGEETAIALIDNGADVNAESRSAYTLLLNAVIAGHTKTAIALINNGADVNAKTSFGETPLFRAVSNAIECYKVGSLQGEGFVYIPVAEGRTEVMLALIEHDADLNFKGGHGINTPIEIILNNYSNNFEFLFDVDSSVVSSSVQEKLFCAALKEDLENKLPESFTNNFWDNEDDSYTNLYTDSSFTCLYNAHSSEL